MNMPPLPALVHLPKRVDFFGEYGQRLIVESMFRSTYPASHSSQDRFYYLDHLHCRNQNLKCVPLGLCWIFGSDILRIIVKPGGSYIEQMQ